MALALPPTGVIRSRGTFDPARFPDGARRAHETGTYLIPAIRRLPGLAAYFAGASRSGSVVHRSLWNSDAPAQPTSTLREMIVDARHAAEAVGVQFSPIVNYPIAWSI